MYRYVQPYCHYLAKQTREKQNTMVTNECAVTKLQISAECSDDANVPGSREQFVHLGQTGTNGGGETRSAQNHLSS